MIQTVETAKQTTGFVHPPPRPHLVGGKGVPVLAPPTPGVTQYTWEEVASHNTESSCWVYFGTKVYDITDWLKKHPGGKQALLLVAGRDLTDLLVNYHPFSGNKPMEILSKYEIGELVSLEFPQFKADSGFYRECRERVHEYFKSKQLNPKDPLPGLIRLFFMFAIAFFSYSILVSSSYSILTKIFFAVIFGIFQALPLLHCMHDSSHLAIGPNERYWNVIGRITMDWFGGASIVSWHNQHIVGHHVYTNIIGADPDLPIKLHGDVRRVAPHQSWMPLYKFQHIYLLVLYGVLAIKFRVQDITDTLIDHSNGAIRVNMNGYSEYINQFFSKSFWAIWRIIIPLYYFNVDSTTFWITFFIAEFTTGYYLTFNFQVSHVSPSAVFSSVENVSFNDEWAVAQMKTTVEYAHGDIIAAFFCGALNYQGVHHLFPCVSQYHYPAIAPIVASVAKKYNVPYYVVPSFWEAFKLHIVHLKNMGFENLHIH